MAAGSALGTVRGLITLVALAAFGPTTVSMYGISLSVYGVAVVLCAGHGIAVVARLSRHHAGRMAVGESRAPFVELLATAWASTVALITLTLLFGVISALVLPVDPVEYATAYAAATIGAVLLPLGQCVIGKQQVLGMERTSTAHSIETFLIGTALALIGIWLAPSASIALVAIGLSGLCADAWGFARRRASLGSQDRGVIRAGLHQFLAAPMTTMRGVPRTAAGGYDGLVLLTTFTTVSQIALHVSPTAGAVTVTVITFVRSIVIPLKSVGLVGGRLVVQQSRTLTHSRDLVRRVIRTVACFLVPVGAVIAIAPWPLQQLLGLPPGQDVEWVIRLVGIQLILEPIAGVGSGMLKVIVKPTSVLLPLLLCMWAFALPTIAILAATQHLTLVGIWLVLLIARVIFSTCVLIRLVHASAAPTTRKA